MSLWTRGALREVEGDPTWHTRVVRNLFEVDCTCGMILCWLTLECDSVAVAVASCRFSMQISKRIPRHGKLKQGAESNGCSLYLFASSQAQIKTDSKTTGP
ncbi:hypothetical protein WN943_018280 [Citrus x changshan-huyou]